jgi:hypothetical protein
MARVMKVLRQSPFLVRGRAFVLQYRWILGTVVVAWQSGRSPKGCTWSRAECCTEILLCDECVSVYLAAGACCTAS